MTPTSARCALALVIVLVATGSVLAVEDMPRDLVLDLRVIEARSTSPDFRTMQELAFFIDTDGRGVSEQQWLATVARKAPGTFLATLALETIPVSTPTADLDIGKRSHNLRLSLDLSEFREHGTFAARLMGDLSRDDESERRFERPIELRLDQTYVWSGPELELSPSEYLSHFRDYEDSERGALYEQLRVFTTFLILTATLRLESDIERDVVELHLADDVELPELDSPLGTDLVGTIELEIDLDGSGDPLDVRVVRSSLPEVNPRILGEAESWRFPDAAGKTGRLVVQLKATP